MSLICEALECGNFTGLTFWHPNFSHLVTLPPHIKLLIAASTQINELDCIYETAYLQKATYTTGRCIDLVPFVAIACHWLTIKLAKIRTAWLQI
ncbi:hypothetical protein DsansV1_C25g0185831 [Dioscorea sansibarensis]